MKTVDLVWLGQRLADIGRLEMQAYAPGVAAAELIIMGDLLDSPPSTITALAERTGYAQSRVSTAVAGLVSRGWAEVSSDPGDGRRTLVTVPVRVRRNAERFRADTENRSLERLLAGRSPARRKAIIAALEELREVLHEETTAARPGAAIADESPAAG